VITRLDGWTWSVTDEAVVLVHPLGPAAGVIKYRERITPIRPLRELLDRRPAPSAVTHDAPEIKRLITDEGEYGALAVVTGVRSGQPTHRVLAIVFGDDWYAKVTGSARDPAQFDALSRTVEQLACRDRLLLGHPRRRRFHYAPPVGWSSYSPLPLAACWFPTSYPNDSRLITVYPALPHNNDQRLELDALPIGPPLPATVLDEVEASIDLVHGPLVGRQWAFRIRNDRGTLIRKVVLLRSAFHYYCLFGDATEATVGSLTVELTKLRDSIEPLPAPRTAMVSSVFDHWV
jgi:hypothetical protein